ncbi:MAG: hypothetical protein ACK5LC_13670 [Coprobacillaceae bacterium]
MRNWGLFVGCFGLYMIMLAPTYNTAPLMILSGLIFILLGVYMYRKGGKKK